jgi:DNA mismatch repair protein MutL
MYSEKKIGTQMLLNPVNIELTHKEALLLEEEKEFFQSLGFCYEGFGSSSVLLRSVPEDTEDGAKELFEELAGFVSENIRRDRKAVADKALFQIACKAAVKANKKLEPIEAYHLIKELNRIENPFTCPHGRPSMFKVSKYELEKLFKRIV